MIESAFQVSVKILKNWTRYVYFKTKPPHLKKPQTSSKLQKMFIELMQGLDLNRLALKNAKQDQFELQFT